MFLFEYSESLNTLFMRFSKDEYENFKRELIDLSKEYDHIEWTDYSFSGVKQHKTEVPEFFQIRHDTCGISKAGDLINFPKPVVEYLPKATRVYFHTDALNSFLENLVRLGELKEFVVETQSDLMNESVFRFSKDSKLVGKIIVILV